MNTISTTKIWDDQKYDTIIDVRSPSEFDEDHIPGALNLPVLDDKERNQIGTVYKKKSPFEKPGYKVSLEDLGCTRKMGISY